MAPKKTTTYGMLTIRPHITEYQKIKDFVLDNEYEFFKNIFTEFILVEEEKNHLHCVGKFQYEIVAKHGEREEKKIRDKFSHLELKNIDAAVYLSGPKKITDTYEKGIGYMLKAFFDQSQSMTLIINFNVSEETFAKANKCAEENTYTAPVKIISQNELVKQVWIYCENNTTLFSQSLESPNHIENKIIDWLLNHGMLLSNIVTRNILIEETIKSFCIQKKYENPYSAANI